MTVLLDDYISKHLPRHFGICLSMEAVHLDIYLNIEERLGSAHQSNSRGDTGQPEEQNTLTRGGRSETQHQQPELILPISQQAHCCPDRHRGGVCDTVRDNCGVVWIWICMSCKTVLLRRHAAWTVQVIARWLSWQTGEVWRVQDGGG